LTGVISNGHFGLQQSSTVIRVHRWHGDTEGGALMAEVAGD
jgi:hypothetical protein